MKKKLSEKAVYEPNNRVKLTVDNKPSYDDRGTPLGYERKVTIVVRAGIEEDKLAFADSDAIADFVSNIDFDDPQQALL